MIPLNLKIISFIFTANAQTFNKQKYLCHVHCSEIWGLKHVFWSYLALESLRCSAKPEGEVLQCKASELDVLDHYT